MLREIMIRELVQFKGGYCMHNENYSIIFSSLTGNTRKLADKIHEILPKESCDYFGTADAQGTESELLYIGFWTDKGNADSDTLDFLSKLKNKKIFLFGTAGFGGSDAYFQRILGNVKSAIDSSNTIVGEYMCQGKMPQSVRERYVKMKENPEHPDNIDALIENFDKALSHPDADDMERLKNIII
jgi:flavodoxin I